MQKVKGLIFAFLYYKFILSSFPYGTFSIAPNINFYLLYFI